MKIFTNKKIWQKIVFVILIILLMQFFIGKPTHAISGDVLLEPITSLFANLGDGIMEIMQKTFLNIETSGAWIEESSNLWAKILIIAAAIVIAVIAVIASVYSGGAALVIVGTALGAVVKIGTTAAVIYFAVDKLHFGEKGFYLPEYYLTPETIFKNEVLAFDVNFFNPKKIEKYTEERDILSETFLIPSHYFHDCPTDYNYRSDTSEGEHIEYGVTWYWMNDEQYKEFQTQYGFSDKNAGYSGRNSYYNYSCTHNKWVINTEERSANEREWEHNGRTYRAFYSYHYDWFQGNCYGILLFREVELGDYHTIKLNPETSLAYTIQPIVASWYVTLRNIALVALLSILVYIGIRITLTSVSSEKAKYKQMLIDWTVAICLVFLMHYIMSFAVTINEYIVKAISSISVSNINEDAVLKSADNKELEKEYNYVTGASGKITEQQTQKEATGNQAGVQLFIIEEKEAVSRAYDTIVGEDGPDSGKNSPFKKRFTDGKDGVLIWPANDFMTQARLLGQNVGNNETQEAVVKSGYNIIYIVLVVYTIIFCFTYLKRVIYMAFLTIIAPLVSITYPIDKLSDGQAQAFNMWLKEYIFNLLMQPMHLILYTVLVGSAMKFAANNIFYVVVALGFLVPAEKLLRRFFGFEKAQTPGMFGGPAASALMMSGINKLMHKPPKGALGAGDKDGGSDGKDDEGKLPFMNNKMDDTEGLFKSNDGDIKDNILGDVKGDNKLKYDKRLSKDQIDELKSEGIKPGDQEYSQYLGNLGLKPQDRENTNLSSLNKNATKVNVPNVRKTPTLNGKPLMKKNGKKRKISIERQKRAIQAGLRSKGDKYKRRYFGKNWRNLTNMQAASIVGKKALGLGAKVALTYAGATAAGIASIAGGDVGKGVQNMAMAGTGGYALGKGIANKIEGINNKEQIDAMREAYYGDDYKQVQQKKAERQFAKDEENLKKIEKKLKVEREEAKEIAEQMAKYTDKDGINDVDTTLAIYQMQQEKDFSEEEAKYAASYNNVALDGKNTNYMKPKDREEYINNFKNRLMNKEGINETEATERANNLFRAMDRFNELKN